MENIFFLTDKISFIVEATEKEIAKQSIIKQSLQSKSLADNDLHESLKTILDKDRVIDKEWDKIDIPEKHESPHKDTNVIFSDLPSDDNNCKTGRDTTSFMNDSDSPHSCIS